jgi:AcrR family transcriptional regulator
VRQSHLTYYFPTRHDLLRATVLQFAESVGAGLCQAVCERPERGRHTPMARLIEAVAELGHMRMFLGLVIEAADDPALRAIVVEGTERVEAALAGVLGGPHAARDARVVLAAAWGLGLYRYAVRPRPERDPAPAALAALERGLPRHTRGRRRVKG